MFSVLTYLLNSSLRLIDNDVDKFYGSGHSFYDAGFLIFCYMQHILLPCICSEINRIRHSIKIPSS